MLNIMQESLIPVGPPPKRRKSPRRVPGPSTTDSNPRTTDSNPNPQLTSPDEAKKIPMLIRGIGVHQVIPKEATRDVLSGRLPFYLVDDKDGVTLFPAKHIFAVLKLDQEHKVKFEDYSCLGGHERFLKEIPRKREGMGYRRRYISPELLNRGIYWVHTSIRIKALLNGVYLTRKK